MLILTCLDYYTIKSSATINVVVSYLMQIVEKLKGFLTWLTIGNT